MKYYGRIAKVGFAWSILSRAIGEMISVPAAMVMARLLSPSDFGVAAAAAFFIQVATRLTNFGFNTALVQLKDPRPEHVSSVFVVNLALGVSMWAAMAAGAPVLGQFFRSAEVAAVIPVAALSFVLGAAGGVPSSLLARDMKFRQSVVIDWAFYSTLAGAGILLAWLGYGYWSIVYAQLMAVTAQTVFRFYFAGWRPSLRFSRAALRDVLAFGLGLHAKRLLESAALNLDNLVVGRTLGITGLGFYDKAFTTMNRAVIAMSTAGPNVSFRIFALIHEDAHRFRLAYRKVLLTASLIGYPAFTWLIIVAPELFEVMFGQQWRPAVLPFQILCGAGLMKLLIAYASTATQSKGWIWSEVWRQLLYVALVIGGVTAGSHWGLAGAAGGVLAATTVLAVLMHALLLRVASLSWRDLVVPQVPALVCSAGLSVGLVALPVILKSVLGFELHAPWQVLAARAAFGGLFYVAFLLFCGFPAVRSLVDETLTDLLPGHVRWLRRQPAAAQVVSQRVAP
jgi:PST family polysaccharide transporter